MGKGVRHIHIRRSFPLKFSTHFLMCVYVGVLNKQPIDCVREPCVLEGWGAFRSEEGEGGEGGREGKSGRRRWPCLRSMAFFNDAYPAPIQSHRDGGEKEEGGTGGGKAGWAWVPSLDLTTHFFERPPKQPPAASSSSSSSSSSSCRPPYLRLRFSTSFVRRGLLICDSEVWAEDSPTLYSTSRQLARLLTPR